MVLFLYILKGAGCCDNLCFQEGRFVIEEKVFRVCEGPNKKIPSWGENQVQL